MQSSHRPQFRKLVLPLCLCLAATGPLAATEHRHDSHTNPAPAKLQLDHGRKWPTDAALRQGMQTLRSDFAGKLAAIHQGKLTAADYQVLGIRIEREVGEIVAKCKLEPAADAMLHLVVADLLAAASVLQGKSPGQRARAAHRAVTALNDYGRHFDHPQWKPLS